MHLSAQNHHRGLYSARYDGHVMRVSASPFIEFSGIKFSPRYISYGLFCCTAKPEVVLLVNPLRGEVMILPRPRVRDHLISLNTRFSIGFDDTTGTYKIVGLFAVKGAVGYPYISKTNRVAKVYTLGTSSWRPISSDAPLRNMNSKAVSAYGDIHWLIAYYEDDMIPGLIFSFNSRIEEFNPTPHPRPVDDKAYKSIALFNLKGSLAMLGVVSVNQSDLWVMKDYDTKEWARAYTLSNDLWAMKRDITIIRSRLIIEAWEHGLCIINASCGPYIYNRTTHHIERVFYRPPNGNGQWWHGPITSYTGTLISLKNYGSLVPADLCPASAYFTNRTSLVYINSSSEDFLKVQPKRRRRLE
ncbi:FBA_3 domain-containing protein [Cephalotus follicularis]|uniref:FBA_3 domain-containing protein n=1 Tax=Cephalotus follicularis TaxID=3775 RepID=A0A1Q3AW52_CEPFO|nr:FBA_3 domain-containing protein [Cephalotus follicularis]